MQHLVLPEVRLLQACMLFYLGRSKIDNATSGKSPDHRLALLLIRAVATIPTIGFNTEEVRYKNIRFNMWDVGGQERIRALWKHYYIGCQACIFMVDSTDHDRFDEACEQLHRMLNDDLLRGITLLVLANKQVYPLPAHSNDDSRCLHELRILHTCIETVMAVRLAGGPQNASS